MKAASQSESKRRHAGCPEEAAFLDLLRTTDLLSRGPAQVLRSEDLSATQYNVLRILRGAGRDGLPTLAIGERMVEKTPGVTRLIDRLIKKGFVTRRPCEEDRRRVYCHLTATGLRVVNSLDESIARGDAISVAPLSPAELDRLIGLLDKIRAHNE